MKRLRSYDDDLDSIGDRGVLKDWSRRDQDSDRPPRRLYLKAENGRKGLSSSSGYDRSIEDDREVSRSSRKRLDHDSDAFERRKSFDRYRDCGDRGISLSSPRTSYSGEKSHWSESFCGSRRDFPKGFRSERERSRRGESVSSWRRLGGSKDCDEDTKFNVDTGRGRRVASEERGNVRSPQSLKDVQKLPPCSKDSGGEQSKSNKVRKNEGVHRESGSSSEMEEGELQPEAEATPEPEVGSEHEHKPNSEHEEPEAEPTQNAEIPGVCTENRKEMESVQSVKVEMYLKKGGESSAEDKIEFKGEDNCDEKQEDGRREPVSGVDKEIGEVPEPLGNSNSEFSTRKEVAVGGNVGREGKDIREDCESVGPCVLTPKCRSTDKATKDEDAKKPLPLDGKDINAREGTAVAVNEGREGENAREDFASLGPCVLTPEDRCTDEASRDKDAEKSLRLDEEQKEGKDINLEGHVKDIDLPNPNPEVANENGTPKVTLNLITDKPTQNSKDKGKSIVVSSFNEANYNEDSAWIEEDATARREDAMEGSSCRGFELFSSPAAARKEKKNDSCVNKQKEKMLKMEPLELSLCLPNVSFELHSHHPKPAPGSPSRMSVQSVPSTFWTGSDEPTASISFSGSQPFVHNPSCSLTRNSIDNYEQSVGSHPLFKGVDKNSPASWLVQLSNEPKYREVPLYPTILQNGNASQSSQGILKHHTMQVQDHSRNSEGTSGVPVPLDWQSSRSRQLIGVPSRNQEESKTPVHSVGTLEVRQEYNEDKKLLIGKRSGSLFCSSNQKEIEQLVVGRSGFEERIIAMIILKPAQEMAKRIHEMTEHSIACLKERACDMILNEDKSGQLHTFQEALRSRSDLTLETLSNCNRTQLEILVAFKTGVQDFLYRAKDSHSTDLAEVFLNLKCRNVACGSPLPVDECDCKVCAQKSGFCSACMCLVCSKFDMASNTCSWVGCDVCLHWCHTSCGLQGSFIRNGYSVTGASGTTEMQFHCLACNHPSEMFGFVKEVFKTCAREWEAEILSKELEYVKRIFSASNDVRGKQLHNLAEKMQARLENDKFTLSEVYNQIMEFLTETDSKLANTFTTEKEQSRRNLGLGSGVLGPSQEPMWLTSFSTEKINPQTVNIGNGASSMAWDREGQLNEDSQLQKGAEKKPVFDELESIVRIKQAEAKMFQSRADDARREAEGLKHIAVAKNDKIEAEYGRRIAKLRLAESEERRRQKLKELQILERSYQEYINMKMRMETEIQDMLLRMDDVKRNLVS